jgi:hypothetical protein
MLDMRFGGVPRFVTGFSAGPWDGGNDDLAPPAVPDAIEAGSARRAGRPSAHYPRRALVALRQRTRDHLKVVK